MLKTLAKSPPVPPPRTASIANWATGAVIALGRWAHDVAGDRIDVEMYGALQLLVDLTVEGRAQRRVGGEVRHYQRDDRDGPDGEEKSEPQGHSGCSGGGLGLAQRVTDQADGVDERRPELLELLAQVAHVGLHDVAVAAEVVVPDVVEDLCL